MHPRALTAAALALAAGAVSAQGITFTPANDVALTQLFNPDGGVFAPGTFTSGQLGVFTAIGNGSFTLTYLGQESAFRDTVRIDANGQQLTESSPVGAFITGPLVAGTPLSFTFLDGAPATNGELPDDSRPSFAVLGTNVTTSRGSFAYVLGYNDSASHDDWDDFVVGLNAVAPIPEPQTYALLLAGLGAVGFVARRRRAR